MERDALDAQVRNWSSADPDAETRAELTRLASTDRVELAARFAGRLEFGTAGLRGPLGAGPRCMNRVIVRMAAQALVDHVRSLRADRGMPLIVIGYDARKNSEVFAYDTAAVAAAAGARALVLPRPLPTPILAFAVRDRQADAGVMVTASHNPAGDNGYKVYLADGAQLIPPHDRAIEARMAHLPLPPRDLPGPASGGSVSRCSTEIVDAYLEAVLGDQPFDTEADLRTLRIAYTPLHGVGRAVFERALTRVGARADVVAEQGEPDATFPTVSFPNPEEPGVLDRGIALARRISADVLIAHDPDADRLAVALPTHHGEWRALSGNEIGALLADHILRTTDGPGRMVVTSIVSSTLLSKLAEAAGVAHYETLTGFKWIVRPALDNPGARFVFGYEEALGFATNDVVRDKDGISAAITFLIMLDRLRRDDRTPFDVLEELAQRFGRHASAQQSIRFPGAAASDEMMVRLQSLRDAPPSIIGGRSVADIVDYTTRQPAADILRFDLEEGARVMMRPSGTEPKLKIYVEIVTDRDARAAQAMADALAADAASLLI